MLDLNVEQKIKKEVKESFVASILLLAFAVVLMINPDNFLNIAINVFGYLGIFFGVINVFIFIGYQMKQEYLVKT